MHGMNLPFLLKKQKNKVFCIGRNKTGTTSLEKALRELGFKMGDQSRAEWLLPYYRERNFSPIIDFCRTADAFQDAPFSYPYTFIALYQAFPDAKFILSVRNTDEEWYQSVLRFQSKNIGKNGALPTAEDLKNATYRYKGFMWEMFQALYQTPENDPYNKETLIAHYNFHNQMARDFFRDKPNFLEINVSEEGTYQKLCGFLNVRPVRQEFPWENKSFTPNL